MDYSCFNAVIDKLHNNNIVNNELSIRSIHFYSFLQLNVLESTVLPCPLCEEEDRYKKLRDASSLDCIKEYFFKKEMPYFEKLSREKLLECDFSYQPFQKKKSSTLLQSAIIHFLNKAIALNHNSIQCFHKTTLPTWNLNGNYKSYINFNGFVEAFRNFIIFEQEHKQCCFEFEKDSKMIVVINELKFKSNLIKVLSGQFCKKYRGIYITIFYWVLCELIAATRTILGQHYNYDGQYAVLTEVENLKNLTDFSILINSSFSAANEVDDFIDKTNYLRLIIKYASSLNIAYLLHKDFIASICKFINDIEAIKPQIQSKYESIEDKSEREELQRKFTENLYVFEDFKVFCAAHISRSLSDNQQRAIRFEQNLNDLYVDESLADKTFLELLLLENTNIIRQTLIKAKNEKLLKKENSLLDDYRKFNTNRDKDLMFEKIKLANELQKSLNDDNPNDGEYFENEEKDNLKKIAKIVGCNIEKGGGILLYKYQNVDKEKIETGNYCVIGKCGNDTSLADYFGLNTVSNNYTTEFLEGINYFTETTDNVKYYWTSYALHKQNEKWIGQNNESQITINDKIIDYNDFSDIKLLTDNANRLLFIRISSYNEKELRGEAVFVFYDKNIEEYDSIHDTRFIHVLRNDISVYLKNKYDNDTFKAWVEERKFLNAPDHNYYNILSDLKEYRNDNSKFEFLYTLLMVKKEIYEILKTKSIKPDTNEIMKFNLNDKINNYCSNMFLKNKIPKITGDTPIIRFHEPLFRHIMYEYLRNARKGSKYSDIIISILDNNHEYKITIQNKHIFVKEDNYLLEQKERLQKYGYADSSKIKGLYLNSLLLEAIGCPRPSIIIELNNDITTFIVTFILKNL